MQGKECWYGREVEGRLYGVLTVFCRSNVPSDIIDYPHIYFTIEYIESAIKDNSLFCRIQELIDQGKAVTIEVTQNEINQIPLSIYNHSHIIFRTNIPEVDRLKENDSVKIDISPYNSYIATKHIFMKITNSDYSFDYVKGGGR